MNCLRRQAAAPLFAPASCRCRFAGFAPLRSALSSSIYCTPALEGALAVHWGDFWGLLAGDGRGKVTLVFRKGAVWRLLRGFAGFGVYLIRGCPKEDKPRFLGRGVGGEPFVFKQRVSPKGSEAMKEVKKCFFSGRKRMMAFLCRRRREGVFRRCFRRRAGRVFVNAGCIGR